jgi:hypothetical protein
LQLDSIKAKLDISINDTSKDGLLLDYLEDAEETILDLTHLDAIPDKLLRTQVELAIIYYNKQGIEGQTSHSEGGISRSFEDMPESMLKKIKSFRRMPR